MRHAANMRPRRICALLLREPGRYRALCDRYLVVSLSNHERAEDARRSALRQAQGEGWSGIREAPMVPAVATRRKQMPEFLRFMNPPTMEKPPGYSHIVEIKGDARIVFFAGQLGVDTSGKFVGAPGDFKAQTDAGVREPEGGAGSCRRELRAPRQDQQLPGRHRAQHAGVPRRARPLSGRAAAGQHDHRRPGPGPARRIVRDRSGCGAAGRVEDWSSRAFVGSGSNIRRIRVHGSSHKAGCKLLWGRAWRPTSRARPCAGS